MRSPRICGPARRHPARPDPHPPVPKAPAPPDTERAAGHRSTRTAPPSSPAPTTTSTMTGRPCPTTTNSRAWPVGSSVPAPTPTLALRRRTLQQLPRRQPTRHPRPHPRRSHRRPMHIHHHPATVRRGTVPLRKDWRHTRNPAARATIETFADALMTAENPVGEGHSPQHPNGDSGFDPPDPPHMAHPYRTRPSDQHPRTPHSPRRRPLHHLRPRTQHHQRRRLDGYRLAGRRTHRARG